MEIVFSEISNKTGPINKTIKIGEDGKLTKDSSANVYSGTGRTRKIGVDSVATYLEMLNDQSEKAIVLGVWPNERWEEYDIVKAEDAKPEEGIIARTKKYFQFANSDSISLIMLDIDGNWPESEITSFLHELNEVLQDSFLDSDVKHDQFMYWSKPSCSSMVQEKGKTNTDRHVFIPVRNANEELVQLIFRFAWLRKSTRSHKISKACSILIRSILDKSTASPERLVFEANPKIEGDLDLVDIHERHCLYVPGAALDCELACMCLREVTASYDIEVQSYVRDIQNSTAFKDQVAEKKAQQTSEYITKGIAPDTAKRMAEDNSRGIILSNQNLIKSDMTEVTVLEVLCDQLKWDTKTYFNDFEDPRPGHNCAMIQFRDDGQCYLFTKRHGEVSYCLKFTFDDLMNWVDITSDKEVEDKFMEFSARCEMNDVQTEKFSTAVSKKVGVSKSTAVKSVKTAAKVSKKLVTLGSAKDAEIESLSGHSDIVLHYLRNQNECRAYAGNLYIWNGGTIWESKASDQIKYEIGAAYSSSSYCRTAGHYNQIARFLVSNPDIVKDNWPSVPGFPCSDGFYEVGKDVPGFVRMIPYTKELGCRYKMKFKPDYTVLTPMFDKVIANVTDQILFQQLFGLLLSGYLRELQKVAVFFGDGGSGKGTTERVLKEMLPKGRVSKVDLRRMNTPEGRVPLADSVINIISEITRTDKPIDIEGLKMITGGDDVSSRKLYEDHGKVFTPKCSHLITINDWPRLDASGKEVERRFAQTIVRFVRSQEEDVVGIDNAIIKNELPGVLAWALEGVRMYFSDGFQSEISRDLFSAWTSSFSPLASFIEDCCVFGYAKGEDKSLVKRSDLWNAFNDYCVDTGMAMRGGPYLVKKQDFNASIEKDSRVIKKKDGKGEWTYYGIAITPKIRELLGRKK